jgi:hypothetical protein
MLAPLFIDSNSARISKTNACWLVIERQEIAISRKKCVIVRTPTLHRGGRQNHWIKVKNRQHPAMRLSFGFLQMTIRGALVWIVLGTGLACCTTPAVAQTYDPNYPVCLHVYAENGYIDRSFTSIAQCNATGSGRGAQCFANPYFAPRVQPARRR